MCGPENEVGIDDLGRSDGGGFFLTFSLSATQYFISTCFLPQKSLSRLSMSNHPLSHFRTAYWIIALMALLPGCLATGSAVASEPARRVIFDTDMAIDCDDAAALWMLHVLANRGEAQILATGVCGADTGKRSGHTVAVINQFHGRPSIPISSGKHCPVPSYSSYTRIIHDEFGSDTPLDDALPDVVASYRQVLADQPDRSVTIAALGMFNNMAALLDSPPDAISDLGGKELLAKKVDQLVVVCGDFPRGVIQYNLGADGQSAIKIFKQWPTSIVVCPAKLGYQLITGRGLQEVSPENPLRRIYEVFETHWMPTWLRQKNMLTHGRPSWDQAALLYAVRGDSECFELSPPGKIDIKVTRVTKLGVSQGTTSWQAKQDGKHRFLSLKQDARFVAEQIESLMQDED